MLDIQRGILTYSFMYPRESVPNQGPNIIAKLTSQFTNMHRDQLECKLGESSVTKGTNKLEH
jgi:hypothetical protein